MASSQPAQLGPAVSAKLKILFLATRDWYHPATTGGDNTMWENARYLASVGHAVTFVAASYPGAKTEEVLEGIKVIRLGGIHSLWLRTFLYYVSRGRGIYDLVVAEGFGGSRIPRMAPLYVKEPIITEWHQIHRDLFAVQYPRLLNGPLNLLERITAWVSRNTRVRAGTEDWQRAFPTIGFKPENVFVVPVSIREDWLHKANQDRPTEPTILWLGKLRRYKCPDHAVQAMAAVVRQVVSARLVIAGRRDDASYENELRRLVERLGLRNHVEFRFDLTELEKRRLIDESRIVVLPSTVEGFGIVVLEANACGVPVIASTGVPEGAVKDGLNGLRYPFGNIKALGDSIVRLLQDDDLYSRLSENALEYAERFSWSRVGAEFERVVLETAARPK
jgi:glycosyltransferase involved in cell wall biosynthesis